MEAYFRYMKKHCRLCLSEIKRNEVVNCENQTEFIDLVKQLYNFEICENNGFASKVCLKCVTKAMNYRRHVESVQNNQTNLAMIERLLEQRQLQLDIPNTGDSDLNDTFERLPDGTFRLRCQGRHRGSPERSTMIVVSPDDPVYRFQIDGLPISSTQNSSSGLESAFASPIAFVPRENVRTEFDSSRNTTIITIDDSTLQPATSTAMILRPATSTGMTVTVVQASHQSHLSTLRDRLDAADKGRGRLESTCPCPGPSALEVTHAVTSTTSTAVNEQPDHRNRNHTLGPQRRQIQTRRVMKRLRRGATPQTPRSRSESRRHQN